MNPRREPSITFPPYRFAQPRQKSLVFYALTSGRFSRLYWSGVAFNGVLQVADAQALQGLLQQVIGHAKAFGCGLLSLARI